MCTLTIMVTVSPVAHDSKNKVNALAKESQSKWDLTSNEEWLNKLYTRERKMWFMSWLPFSSWVERVCSSSSYFVLLLLLSFFAFLYRKRYCDIFVIYSAFQSAVEVHFVSAPGNWSEEEIRCFYLCMLCSPPWSSTQKNNMSITINI